MNQSALRETPWVIQYVEWHYGVGLHEVIRIWGNFLEFTYHHFSLPLLVRTLFAPFKRTYKVKHRPGFSFEEIFDRLTFNIVSRVMGAVVRSFVIAVGIMALLAWLVLGALAVTLWIPALGFTIPWFQRYRAARSEFVSIWNKLATPKGALEALLSTQWGIFLLGRLGLEGATLVNSVEDNLILGAGQYPKEPTLLSVFLAIYEYSKGLQRYLFTKSIMREDILWISQWFDRQKQEAWRRKAFWERDYLLHMQSIGKTWTYGYTPVLDQYTTDLSRGEVPFKHFIGRTKEIESIERILTKRAEGNILLVGEPGVGKHPLLVHLAHLVVQGRVLPELENKRLLQLNMEQLFSSEVDVTQRKTSVSLILEEAASAGNIVLVIDEFDRFVASGADRMDVSDVFAHMLSRNTVQIIALVVPGALHQYIEHNKTLTNHFEIVEMRSLDKEEALLVVSDVLRSFESPTLYFLYEAIRELVNDADRLIKDVPFPEKAMNLLDEVVTYANSQKKVGAITANDIKGYLTQITHVPVALASEDKQKLLNLEKILHERVIGQNEAVYVVAQALRRARSDVSARRDKPIGTFLFLGPTGVGKTETAKALAQAYFGNEASLVRFDMSEFQDSSAIKQFLGDFTSGKVGVFAQKASENPYTVLLLDELEKADRSIINVFLTAIDEGYVTDAFGKKLYLTNMIIIATSNAGAEFIRQKIQAATSDTSTIQKDVIEYIQREGIFSPEFLNRFDSVTVFHPLSYEHARQVLVLALKRFAAKAYEQHGVTVTVSEQTMDKVIAEGFDPEYGGRALNRAIQTHVEEPFAQKVLRGEAKRGASITI